MAEGRASEVLEVNFDDGIILPRGTPAMSGVMHSMSSMPLMRSQSAASFQVLTPLADCRAAGTFTLLLVLVDEWAIVFLDDMKHRL